MGLPKNIFVSMPMREKTKLEIDKEFRRIEQKFDNAIFMFNKDPWYSGVRILNSLFDITTNDDDYAIMPVKLLGQALQVLATADIAFFAHGWENARGCKIEYDVCKAYGIPIIEEDKLPNPAVIKRENEPVDYDVEKRVSCEENEYPSLADLHAHATAINTSLNQYSDFAQYPGWPDIQAKSAANTTHH